MERGLRMKLTKRKRLERQRWERKFDSVVRNIKEIGVELRSKVQTQVALDVVDKLSYQQKRQIAKKLRIITDIKLYNERTRTFRGKTDFKALVGDKYELFYKGRPKSLAYELEKSAFRSNKVSLEFKRMFAQHDRKTLENAYKGRYLQGKQLTKQLLFRNFVAQQQWFLADDDKYDEERVKYIQNIKEEDGVFYGILESGLTVQITRGVYEKYS